MVINKSKLVLTKCDCGFEANINEFENVENTKIRSPLTSTGRIAGSLEYFADVKCPKCGKIFETQL